MNITAPRITSASTLSSVCETSVPSTAGRRSRGRPSRRATISARDGSPSRAGSVADISTPIVVPWIASTQPRQRVRQRGAQDRVPGDGAREHRDAHQREADEHPDRLGLDERVGDRPHADAVEREQRAADGAGQRGADRRRGGRSASARWPPRRAAGSSDGSRRAGERGPAVGGQRADRGRRRAPAARLGLRHGARVLVGRRRPARRRAARRSARRCGRPRRRAARSARGSSARSRSVSASRVASPRGTSRPSAPSVTTSR